MKFRDSYLTKKFEENNEFFQKLKADWQIAESEFTNKLDSWFNNFNIGDKDLAMKILSKIRYYSKPNFEMRLRELFQPIEKYLTQFNIDSSNLLIILPENIIDSSVHHAYSLSKIWKIPEDNFVSIEHISSKAITKETVLIAFNDTHGSGNQFMYDIWLKLKKLKSNLGGLPKLFILSITISEKALQYFKHSFIGEKITIIPDFPEPSALEIFSAKDFNRISDLCYDVYPKHHMGFGNTGLLTAYYFQCPNNSLPIIWADGNNNKITLAKGTPWSPLFVYNPKPKALEEHSSDCNDSFVKFTEKTNLSFNETEITEINKVLKTWNYDQDNGGKKINSLTTWFNNFTLPDKEIALKLFRNTNFMTIERVRSLISDLGKKVFKDIHDNGGEKSEILLVLTGYEKASVYHHVYDFLKIWNLKITQAITIEELVKKKYDSLNKNLVFFYHTRAGKGNYFISEIWNQVKDLPVKKHYLLSFVLSEQNMEYFNSIKQKYQIEFYYSSELSKTIKQVFDTSELERIKAIYDQHNFDVKFQLENDLLLSYYFVSPKKTTKLLNGVAESWLPLFI